MAKKFVPIQHGVMVRLRHNHKVKAQVIAVSDNTSGADDANTLVRLAGGGTYKGSLIERMS